MLDLKAVAAPNRAAAAAYYPGIYWYSMLHIPDAKLFPGTGPQGNGMPVTLKDQGQWLRYAKTDGCIHCHQLGDLATRTIPGAARPFQHRRGSLGAPHAIGTGRPRHDGGHRPVRHGTAIAAAGRLDRPRRQRRIAENRSARAPAASNATSSSPNGTGTRPRPMSMTAFRPTSAIRASTRTA